MTNPATPPAPPPYSDHGATTPDRIAAETTRRIAAETMRRVAEQAAHEQMRAEFLRDLTSGGPVSCGPLPPLPAGAYAPFPRGPSCCGAALPAEPDDRVTDDLRDLVASQSLAMASARTKQGVAMAAMVVLTAAKGDAISDALARGLRTVLGGVGDLFDGVDLDGVVRQVVGQAVAPAPTPRPAGEGLRIAVPVEIDGAEVGSVTVPVFAVERDVIEVIRQDAVLMARIPDGRRVTGVVYVPGKVARIATGPAEAPGDSVPPG